MPYPESCPECGSTFRNTGTHFTARRNEVGRHVLLELGCQNTTRRFWWDFTTGSPTQDGRPGAARPAPLAVTLSGAAVTNGAVHAETNGHGSVSTLDLRQARSLDREESPVVEPQLVLQPEREQEPAPPTEAAPRPAAPTEAALRPTPPEAAARPAPLEAAARPAPPRAASQPASPAEPPLPVEPPAPPAPALSAEPAVQPEAERRPQAEPEELETHLDSQNVDLSGPPLSTSTPLKDAFVRQLQLDRLTLRQMRSWLMSDEARRAIEVAAGATEATYERLALILFGVDLPQLQGKQPAATPTTGMSAEERLELQRERARIRARLRRAAAKAARQPEADSAA
jgi:hypothetical protein